MQISFTVSRFWRHRMCIGERDHVDLFTFQCTPPPWTYLMLQSANNFCHILSSLQWPTAPSRDESYKPRLAWFTCACLKVWQFTAVADRNSTGFCTQFLVPSDGRSRIFTVCFVWHGVNAKVCSPYLGRAAQQSTWLYDFNSLINSCFSTR